MPGPALPWRRERPARPAPRAAAEPRGSRAPPGFAAPAGVRRKPLSPPPPRRPRRDQDVTSSSLGSHKKTAMPQLKQLVQGKRYKPGPPQTQNSNEDNDNGSVPPPASGRKLLTSAPALTSGPCVWRCDFAARRPGWPWGGQGALARPARGQAGRRRSKSPLGAQPRAGAAPGGAGSRRRGERALAAHPAGPAWCPRVPRGNAIPSAQEERAGERAGGRRAGGAGEREREEKSSRAAWLRSLADPGARWVVCAPTAPPGGPRDPLRAPPPHRTPATPPLI
nr:basic salivary proline-rich protein 2-like [Marmota flaviventris]